MRRSKTSSKQEFREAETVMRLSPDKQKEHPSAVSADQEKLKHVSAMDPLPDFYIDKPYICGLCVQENVWKAKEQKYYYEELKNHIYAKAVECSTCRIKKRKMPNAT